ncbi:MAG: TetR/AcrR family transcriptional regulator, partial [Ilumatobacteraceae bacterium]
GKLIEATQRLLAKGGAHALTSRAIASAADANLASITYYFGSKERLVTESMIATARELLAPVVTTLSSNAEPTARMIESVVLLNRILGEHRDDLAPYLQVLAASPTNPSIAVAIQALHRDMAQLLAEQISVQQAAGQLPSWVSPTAMAQLIVAVVHGTLLASVVDPGHADEAAIGEQFAQLLLGARTARSQ